ncbi:UDP-glucuronosyltransferase 3A2 [Ambystoma mexicanum]|uniref:UDP-glucuronosyltransferase 3A2 n=1 Tax=Ambystoma mexicanum TaxID=8296 RepID=UPI0037E8F120
MARREGVFFCFFFLQNPILSETFKILTLALVGGSHYLLMDEISHVLQDNGHDVTMLLRVGNIMIPGFNDNGRSVVNYKIIPWSTGEENERAFKAFFEDQQNEFLDGRQSLSSYLKLMDNLAVQCSVLMNQSAILNSIRSENFDIVVVDGFNPCCFLLVEKLSLPFVVMFPTLIANGQQIGLPCPPSYVPVYQSHLTDRMGFWERVQNVFMYVGEQFVHRQVEGLFHNIIKDHYQEGARPVLYEIYQKAELWFYNTDLSIDFARPLHPNVVYLGGILAKAAQPVPHELEEFIATSGDAGFIVITLGSMLSSVQRPTLLREMNAGLARMPQKVIWRYQGSKWPAELELAPNVRILDWIPQNDLLGHHKARLFVTHCGMNSLLEAIHHGIPVLGIPLFGDQFDNMARVSAKNFGIAVPPEQLTAERFATAMMQLIADPRYKSAAAAQSKIHRSHPFPPDQRLVRWIEHIIISKGGGHLRPYGTQQPWYQQYLLDVALFLCACFAAAVYISVKVTRAALSNLCRQNKLKKN